MNEYTVHHAPLTRSVRAIWALRELGLPHRVVQRELAEFVADRSWRTVSTTGRVPCVETPAGERWVESLAIIQLLFETHAHDSPMWRPAGHPQRAALLQWLNIGETVQVHLQSLNQQLFFIRPAEARSAATVKLELARLKLALAMIDAGLGDQPYLLGDDFTAVDVSVGYTVATANIFRPLADWPRLVAYVERLLARPAAQGVLVLPQTLPQPLL